MWPTATRLATIYAGGSNGVFGAWDSGLQFTGPSAPYLKFSLGDAKVRRLEPQLRLFRYICPCSVLVSPRQLRHVADICQLPQAKTAFVKSPGVEVDWEGPIELHCPQGATHLTVIPTPVF